MHSSPPPRSAAPSSWPLSNPALGKHVELAVAPLGQPGDIVRLGDGGPVTPASLLKLVTLTAAVEVLGADHRFPTTVVQGRSPSDVVLVGGGDPLLAVSTPGRHAAQTYPRPATLTDLAQQTARRLTRDGVKRVHLQYDSSLFQGPAADPAWPHSYLRQNVVSPISALWVNEGRVTPVSVRRATNPAQAAATSFAGLLRRDGIVVTGPARATSAAPGAAELARVLSPPVYEIVQHVISVSDNEGAEVLFRQAAIATGRSGSFRGGVRTVRATLADLGLNLSGARFSDGSGLSRSDRVPVPLLLDVLQRATDPRHPELHTLLSALPVAGFSGSLAYRFVSDGHAGLGVIRAKTGTLTGVHGLAGVTTTSGGSALVFAVVADRTPARLTPRTQSQIDRIAALLATCGCSGTG